MIKRIEKIDPDTLTGEPREIFERWSPGGNPLNIVLIYFRNSELNRNWSYMATHLFMKNSLADRQREIVVLRTSWQCASDYEFIQHVRIAREGKLLSDHEIFDLTNKEPTLTWPENERALIDASDELVASHGVSDKTWSVLIRHFNNQQIMDIVATAGGYTLNSMATSSFGVDIEDTMKREVGLSPSWNGPAFCFLQSNDNIASVSAQRIAPGNIEDLDEKAAARIAPYQASGARTAFLSMLAQYPVLVKDWMPIIHYVDRENTLSSQERAVIGIRTAMQCRSETELSDRKKAAHAIGMSDAAMAPLLFDRPKIEGSERLSLLVRAVDQLIDEKIIGDKLWQCMTEYFSDEELMDVVFATATQLMISWMQNTLGIREKNG